MFIHSYRSSLHSFLLPRPLSGSGVCLLTFVLNPPHQFCELLSILIDLFCTSLFNTWHLQTSEQHYEVVLNVPATVSHRGSASSAGPGPFHSQPLYWGTGELLQAALTSVLQKRRGGRKAGSGALFLMELRTVWRLKTILITKQCFLSCT